VKDRPDRVLLDSSRMISQASVLASAQYFSAFLGFLTTAVAARWLSPSEYGMAAIAIALPTLVFTLADVKSTSVTTRYVAMFSDRGERHRLAEV
jgi:O-antigen/teichoic acid export membrane protein